MTRLLIPLFLFSALPLWGNPFGVFHFNLPGETAVERVEFLTDIGYDGLVMILNNENRLNQLAEYRAADPDFRIFAGYLVAHNVNRPEGPDPDHVRDVVSALSDAGGKLWLIVNGSKEEEAVTLDIIRNVADLAAEENVGLSLYPHDNTAIESAEEALDYLQMARRSNISITVHLCHEMRAGNGDRLHEVIAAVRPYLDIASVSGTDTDVNQGSTDWSDVIKPLGQGDFDVSIFTHALAAEGFEGPVILHTFRLGGEPDSHYQDSFTFWESELLIPPGSFAAWGARQFPDHQEYNDPDMSGPSAVPFDDGIANLLKFAFGMDVRQTGQDRLPETGMTSEFDPESGEEREHLALTFHRDPGNAGIAYIVEASSSADHWAEVLYDSRIDLQPNNLGDRMRITDSQPLDASARRFMRVRVLLLSP